MTAVTHVQKRLKIGELSKQTGLAVGAVRYYESSGLLHSQRGSNGYRYYLPAAVRQVRFIIETVALNDKPNAKSQTVAQG